jgi:flagellar basal-body rod protein FlgC
LKIGGSLFGLSISSKGMSIQRRKMDLISQNIANADNVRTENGESYKRKFLKVEADQNQFMSDLQMEGQALKIQTTNKDHISVPQNPKDFSITSGMGEISMKEETDAKQGDMIYMPENPEANSEGYVEMSNVNIINEMVDMIAATRSYEANLQALNSAKTMAKDSLEI